MTNIEQKALELVNEVSGSGSWTLTSLSHPYNRLVFRSLCKAIERHEAFRQEVSDAVSMCRTSIGLNTELDRFIIAKPDPLMEALKDMDFTTDWDAEDVKILRAALAKRGLEIREKAE